jgi:hypothetical protein
LSAAARAAGLKPEMGLPPMIVTGIVLKPSAISSSYAESSSSTLRAVNAYPSRERNSFTCSHDRQCEPEYTMMSVAIS